MNPKKRRRYLTSFLNVNEQGSAFNKFILIGWWMYCSIFNDLKKERIHNECGVCGVSVVWLA